MEKFSVTLKRDYHPYTTPLPVRHLTLHGNTFTHVKIKSEKGHDAEIYISSLPDFHLHNDLESAVIVKNIIEDSVINFNQVQFDQPAFNMIKLREEYHPEILYHLETLLLLLLDNPTKEVKENALYSPSKSMTDYKNVECLKIKIGPHLLPQNFSSLINQLLETNPDMRFRLDGNQRFEGNELFQWLNVVLKNSPKLLDKMEYIEEPFLNFADMWWATKVPNFTFAIDESILPFYKAGKLSQLPTQSPWIIKPSLFGISSVVKILKEFPHQKIIISSSFEHSSYKNALAFLADQRPKEFHGLTTISF